LQRTEDPVDIGQRATGDNRNRPIRRGNQTGQQMPCAVGQGYVLRVIHDRCECPVKIEEEAMRGRIDLRRNVGLMYRVGHLLRIL